jgi:ribosomal protein L40E
VTAWSDRPVRNQDWSGEAASADEAVPANQPVAAQPAALPAAPTPAGVPPAPSAQPAAEPELQTPWLMPHRSDPHLVDARSAAAVRLSAVLAGETQPVASAELGPAVEEATVSVSNEPITPVQPPLFDLQPDLQVGRRSEIPEPPAWPQTGLGRQMNRDAVPTASWQPLGSSWPAPANPNSSWTAAEMPSVLSVVAAQQAAEPTVTEMWAQSSQEVMNRGTVRVCHRCALPVSTQARFCRRCGTEQG